eukprot:TRINITY_DN10007_c0_g1_i4.p1 TRINITY_DN10007_c0_g1~~TRINITY_DN10007_c0_g1_i4.p1  ORF type:complete len:144 (+),score=35.52 TRINITY_DN10007_c0_g1_i4:73-504(+)
MANKSNEDEHQSERNEDHATHEELTERLNRLNLQYEDNAKRHSRENNETLVSLMALNRVCAIAGISNRKFYENELNEDVFKIVADKLREKLDFIKSKLSPEEFQNFIDGKHDFHSFYEKKLGLGFSAGMSRHEDGEEHEHSFD